MRINYCYCVPFTSLYLKYPHSMLTYLSLVNHVEMLVRTGFASSAQWWCAVVMSTVTWWTTMRKQATRWRWASVIRVRGAMTVTHVSVFILPVNIIINSNFQLAFSFPFVKTYFMKLFLQGLGDGLMWMTWEWETCPSAVSLFCSPNF